jgi:tetratricopeptide (TPR) repeat protein
VGASNRSQALLKLSRWHEAEVDASTALTLDPTQVKALFRRAQARRQLRKFAGALTDLQELAKLDAQNKPAQALAVEVAALLKKQQEAKAKEPGAVQGNQRGGDEE